MGFVLTLVVLSLYPFIFMAAPQQPEINDQYEVSQKSDTISLPNFYLSEEVKISKDKRLEQNLQPVKPTLKITYQIFHILTAPIGKLLTEPKVLMVLKNIGTCIVNGVMEIISYYFPAPLMPLIATAAGMLIPFEPVVTLRRRMPVTSYRRAIKTAVNSFLDTFGSYKVHDFDDDPYMTRRFNRRFLNGVSEEKRKQ
ncbi:unnamed protein product [Colias eurytheme]|nr:unnamed protein product [Colias eurytheme]